MEISVYTAMVDKHGAQLVILVLALPNQFGMGIHATIHVAEEELLMYQADNASAHLEIGMEHHALFAQVPKFGQLQHYHAFVPQEIGTDLPVSIAQILKYGSPEH
jgi:hypothetical protein